MAGVIEGIDVDIAGNERAGPVGEGSKGRSLPVLLRIGCGIVHEVLDLLRSRGGARQGCYGRLNRPRVFPGPHPPGIVHCNRVPQLGLEGLVVGRVHVHERVEGAAVPLPDRFAKLYDKNPVCALAFLPDRLRVDRVGERGAVEVIGIDVEFSLHERAFGIRKFRQGRFLAVGFDVSNSAVHEGDEGFVGGVGRDRDRGYCLYRGCTGRLGAACCYDEEAEGQDREEGGWFHVWVFLGFSSP